MGQKLDTQATCRNVMHEEGNRMERENWSVSQRSLLLCISETGALSGFMHASVCLCEHTCTMLMSLVYVYVFERFCVCGCAPASAYERQPPAFSFNVKPVSC